MKQRWFLRRVVSSCLVCGVIVTGAEAQEAVQPDPREAIRDSLLYWLATDNREAWIQTCANSGEAVAVLSSWGISGYANPNDSRWDLMRLGVHGLQVRNPRPSETPLSPQAYQDALLADRTRAWRLGAGMLAALLGLGWVGVRRERQRLIAVCGALLDDPGLGALRTWLMGWPWGPGRFPKEAWSNWQTQVVQEPVSAKWRLLSPSEQECAVLLHRGMKVAEVAVSLACTVSYVYNVRSSIRKKWGLAEEEDVVDAIRKELSFDEN